MIFIYDILMLGRCLNYGGSWDGLGYTGMRI